MKKILVLMVIVLSTISANATVLADSFNSFIKNDGVSTMDVTSEMNKSVKVKKATMAIPEASPNMLSYPILFEAFRKKLPSTARLNKGKLETGEPETFFIQPSPTSDAEVILIFYGDKGLNAVTYLVLPASEAKDFKKDFTK